MKFKITFQIRGIAESFTGYCDANSIDELEGRFKDEYFLHAYDADHKSLLNYSLDNIACYSIAEYGDEKTAEEKVWQRMSGTFEGKVPHFKIGDRVIFNGTLGINTIPVSDDFLDVLLNDTPVDMPLKEGEKGAVEAIDPASGDLLIKWDDASRPKWFVQRACVDLCADENVESTTPENDQAYINSVDASDENIIENSVQEMNKSFENMGLSGEDLDPDINQVDYTEFNGKLGCQLENTELKPTITLKSGDILTFNTDSLPVFKEGKFMELKIDPSEEFKIISIGESHITILPVQGHDQYDILKIIVDRVAKLKR